MLKLKEIAVMAKNDTSYAEEIRKFIEQTAKEDYFNSFPFIQYKVAGQDRVTARCTCGEHIDRDNTWSTWSCKKCGKVVTYGCSIRQSTQNYHYVTAIKKFDEGFFVNYYETEVSIIHGSGTIKEQLDNPEVLNYRISPVCMAVYSKKYGPALYEGKKVNRLQYVPSSLYRTESLKVFGDLNEIKTEYSCDTTGIVMQDIWATMKALPFEDSGVNAAKKADKEEKERKAEAEIRKNVDIEAATAEMEKIAHGCFPSGTEEYETSTSGFKLYACVCGKCGHVFTSHDRKDLFCEECGSNIDVCSYIQQNMNVLLTDWSVDAEGNLILARYSGYLSPVGSMADWVKAGRSKYRLDPASVRLCDLARFTNTPSARPVKWVVGPSDCYAPWRCSSEHYVRTPLSDVVGRSSFKFANVEQVVKLTKKNYTSDSYKLTNSPVVQYLENCARYPFIVGLVSRGLYPVAEELCKYIDNDRSLPAQYRGKTDVREAMGISKTILKLATKYQMNLYDIRLLKAMMAEDSALSYECFDWFNTTLHEAYCYTLRDIIASVNKHIIKPIHFEDVRTYLKSLYYDQCIDYTGGVQTWDDYLKAMDQLGFKPASYRQKLFPSSLKKEHDILQFAIRNIDMRDKAEAFKDTIETGKKLEYSFEDLMIRMPQSVEEIVEEGVHLHHSVAQHIEKVANKKEYIAFIREKAAPDTPYYTVEVIREGRGKIVQARSFSNLPADDRIKAFLKKWASYKKLTIASL